MAKNDNLKDFITDIADAIRQKKGSTELINPQDFSNEIINIQSSTGGSGSGSSSVESGESIVITKVYEIAAYTQDSSSKLSRCAVTKVFNNISPNNIYTNYGALEHSGSGSGSTEYVTWYMPMDENYDLLDSFFVSFVNGMNQTNQSKEEVFQEIDNGDINNAQYFIEPLLTSFAQILCVCAISGYDYNTTMIYSAMYEHFSSDFSLHTNDIILNSLGIKVDGSKIGLNNMFLPLTAVDATEFPTVTVNNGLYNVFKDWIINRFPNNGQALINKFINDINEIG